MTLEEVIRWVEEKERECDQRITEIADMPWDEYAAYDRELTSYIAKASVLRRIEKKLKEID